MRNPFSARAIEDTIQRALAAAGLDTSKGTMRDATQTIHRALGSDLSEDAPALDEPGRFEAHEFSNPAGTRAYRLYVPAALHAPAPALLVMLHGCTQSATDFALGTRMNHWADQHGFLVLYPEQPSHANPSKCWNWFNPQDQARDAGEPSLIAGMVRDVVVGHGVDSRRIFVAGLSAGAAMAVVMGETYPELFAGVGAHSGLPFGSAHDVPSALAAMKGGRSGLPGLKQARRAQAQRARKAVHAVPTIVFHGDRDHTVQASNASQIVQQALDAHHHLPLVSAPTTNGPGYSQTVHRDASGVARVESWTLHGAGHAWSGGDARGSYTSATGPDASAEMVRFFLALDGFSPTSPAPG